MISFSPPRFLQYPPVSGERRWLPWGLCPARCPHVLRRHGRAGRRRQRAGAGAVLEGRGSRTLRYGSTKPLICSFFHLKKKYGVTAAGLFGPVRRAGLQQRRGQLRSPRCDAASWPGVPKKGLDRYLGKKKECFFVLALTAPARKRPAWPALGSTRASQPGGEGSLPPPTQYFRPGVFAASNSLQTKEIQFSSDMAGWGRGAWWHVQTTAVGG